LLIKTTTFRTAWLALFLTLGMSPVASAANLSPTSDESVAIVVGWVCWLRVADLAVVE
jgi:hypothetical protein